MHVPAGLSSDMKYGPKRSMLIFLVAALFGVLVAVLKGSEAGVRDSLGNISAPWLLLPYFAGTMFRGPVRGATMGTIACLTALAAFYVSESIVLDLGSHSWLTDLSLTLRAGRQFFLAALVCGPVLGAIGGVPTCRRRVVTAAIVGLSLVGEPPVLFAWLGREGLAASDSGMVVHYAPLWVGEMVLGLVLAVVITVRRSSRPGQPPKTWLMS